MGDPDPGAAELYVAGRPAPPRRDPQAKGAHRPEAPPLAGVPAGRLHGDLCSGQG